MQYFLHLVLVYLVLMFLRFPTFFLLTKNCLCLIADLLYWLDFPFADLQFSVADKVVSLIDVIRYVKVKKLTKNHKNKKRKPPFSSCFLKKTHAIIQKFPSGIAKLNIHLH